MFRKNSTKKGIEQRMAVKKTITKLESQIRNLESQKKKYIDNAKEAKQRGLDSQYNLALNALYMTINQQNKLCEMKLNVEITAQMKDMGEMTEEFLKGMGVLSKEMAKLTKNKEFANIEKQFAEAIVAADTNSAQVENFMGNTQAAFDTPFSGTSAEKMELEKLITSEIEDEGDKMSKLIEKDLNDIKKQLGGL